MNRDSEKRINRLLENMGVKVNRFEEKKLTGEPILKKAMTSSQSVYIGSVENARGSGKWLVPYHGQIWYAEWIPDPETGLIDSSEVELQDTDDAITKLINYYKNKGEVIKYAKKLGISSDEVDSQF